MKNYLLVFIATGCGGVLRFAINTFLKWDGVSLPIATLVVNIVGCFVIGAVLATALRNPYFADNYKLLLATGFCGGFTTFSALSAECMQLLKQQQVTTVIIYIVASIVLGLAACFFGNYLFTN
jgi:fluoride exporter